MYLVADSRVVELGARPLIIGLDMLFKMYHVFNAEYPLGWSPFWEMIEHGVYQIDTPLLANTALEVLQQLDFESSNVDVI